MLHLHSERLAELADDEPTATEAIHLASCPACAVARRFHQQLLVAARREGQLAQAPLTNWESLSARLAAAGLMVARKPAVIAGSRVLRRVGAVAAAIAILVVGAAGGRMSAGAPIVPGKAVAQDDSRDSLGAASFSSTAEALNVYLGAQRDFQRAAAYLNANDSSAQSPNSYYTRLAALEQMHAASVAALRESPTDPVLNNYYLSTLNARDATRRQIARVVPVGSVVKNY